MKFTIAKPGEGNNAKALTLVLGVDTVATFSKLGEQYADQICEAVNSCDSLKSTLASKEEEVGRLREALKNIANAYENDMMSPVLRTIGKQARAALGGVE